MQSLAPSTFARHVSRASTEAVVGAAFSVQLAQLRQLLQLLLLLLLLALTMTSLAWPAVLLSVSKPGKRAGGGGRRKGIEGLDGLVLTSALTKARIALSSAG